MADEIDLGALSADNDLKELITKEQQKMQFQQQINRLNDICWEKCVTDKLSGKFDRRTESCLSNCVGRFIDTSLVVSKKFAQILQSKMGG